MARRSVRSRPTMPFALSMLLTSLVVIVVILAVMLTSRKAASAASASLAQQDGAEESGDAGRDGAEEESGDAGRDGAEGGLADVAVVVVEGDGSGGGSAGDLQRGCRAGPSDPTWAEQRRKLTSTYRMARAAGWEKTLDDVLDGLDGGGRGCG